MYEYTESKSYSVGNPVKANKSRLYCIQGVSDIREVCSLMVIIK